MAAPAEWLFMPASTDKGLERFAGSAAVGAFCQLHSNPKWQKSLPGEETEMCLERMRCSYDACYPCCLGSLLNSTQTFYASCCVSLLLQECFAAPVWFCRSGECGEGACGRGGKPCWCPTYSSTLLPAGLVLRDTADRVMLWMVFQRDKALGVPAGKAGPLSAVAQQGSAKFELLCTEMPRGSWGRLLGTCYWATLKPTSGAPWPGWQRVHLGGILFVVHQCPVPRHQLL